MSITAKFLVLGGEPYSESKKLDIIDMANPNYQCRTFLQFPNEMSAGIGALIYDQIPLICGGHRDQIVYGQCYKLENGKFGEIDSIIPRSESSSSNIVIFESLWIGGGRDLIGTSKSSELIGMNRSTPYPDLAKAIKLHCAIQINETTILVTGGKAL